MLYYNAERNEIRELDQSLIDAWAAANNPKLAQWQAIPDPPADNAQWSGTEWVIPPPYVPQSITRRQAKLIMLQYDLLDDVEAIMATLPRAAQIEWQDALTFERSNPLIGAVAATAGLTEEQLDAMFTAGAAL